MIRRPTRSTRTDTLFPYTTLVRSQAVVGLPVEYQSRGRPADPPEAEGSDDPDCPEPAALRRTGAALLPGRRLRGPARRRRKQSALPDQCAKLRPLQNLRHQGSGAEYQLDRP